MKRFSLLIILGLLIVSNITFAKEAIIDVNDTSYSIAKRTGHTLAELRAMNPKVFFDFKHINAGEKYRYITNDDIRKAVYFLRLELSKERCKRILYFKTSCELWQTMKLLNKGRITYKYPSKQGYVPFETVFEFSKLYDLNR